MATFAFIHSPLVGPFTWLPVAAELRRRGWSAAVPNLHDGKVRQERPYYQQHADNATGSLLKLPENEPLILVAHSGAGPLLPLIRQGLPHAVIGYLFVDAGIARHGESRLEMLAAELPKVAPKLRKLLNKGERWPQWTDLDLAELVPDLERRQRLLAELTPQPLAFFDENIPVFAGWPEAPCAYLQLSAGYNFTTVDAGQRGWPVIRLEAGHFHMLVDEAAVADHLLALCQRLGVVKPLKSAQ